MNELILELLAIIVLIYCCFLMSIRLLGLWRKHSCSICSNCCPKCKSPLNRIPKCNLDRILIRITLFIYEFNRYKCAKCQWEGLKR